MNSLAEEYFKWLMWKIFAVATLWAGWYQGMSWCKTVFKVYIYGSFTMGIVTLGILLFMRHLVKKKEYTDIRGFNDKVGDKKFWMRSIPAYIFNIGMAVFLANIGEGVLAWFTFMSTALMLVLLYVISDVTKMVREQVHERDVREHRQNFERQQRNHGVSDVFDNDDEGLFRMGITSSTED